MNRRVFISLGRPAQAPICDHLICLEGESSWNIRTPEDFALKMRVFLDDLNHLKYLNHLNLWSPEDGSASDRERLKYLTQKLPDVVADMWRSLGSYQDSRLGLKNMLENLSIIVEKPDLSHLRVAQPFSACVIAAGPSLELEFETLRTLQNRVLLVAVDAAFKTLLKQGIQPHIVVAMERDEYSPRFFKGLPNRQKTLLLCHATVQKDLIDSYPGPAATSLKYSGPFLWLPMKRAQMWTASSSAHLAFQVCSYLGAEKIALVGQDLCFHPESFQSHCEIPDYPDWGRPQAKDELQKNPDIQRAQGNTYPEVLTQSVWQLFARDYHILIRDSKSKTTNTSRLGMKIADLPYESLTNWASALSRQSLEFHFPESNPYRAQDAQALKNKLKDSIVSLGGLQAELETSLESGNFEKLYDDLLNRPHFLELVFELILVDWVKSENKVVELQSHESSLVKKRFLEVASKALKDVLGLLKTAAENL